MSQRPTGITILAVLAVIGGLVSLALGGFLTIIGPTFGNEMAKQAAEGSAAVYGGAMMFLGIGLLVHGLFQFVAAYGLFTLKPWAWMLAVLIQILSLILNGLQAIQGQLGGAIVATLIAGGILYYLFRPHIKAVFGRA